MKNNTHKKWQTSQKETGKPSSNSDKYDVPVPWWLIETEETKETKEPPNSDFSCGDLVCMFIVGLLFLCALVCLPWIPLLIVVGYAIFVVINDTLLK